MMMDVDYFKQINDTYGHAVGDRVLYKVGHLLKSSFRENDIVGRIGGDEFLIFMRESLQKNLPFGGWRIYSSISENFR